MSDRKEMPGAMPAGAAESRSDDSARGQVWARPKPQPPGDLVKRLRATEPSYPITGEAADRIERLEEALRAITIERDGRFYFRTANGIPMEMRPNLERITRAALQDDKP